MPHSISSRSSDRPGLLGSCQAWWLQVSAVAGGRQRTEEFEIVGSGCAVGSARRLDGRRVLEATAKGNGRSHVHVEGKTRRASV